MDKSRRVKTRFDFDLARHSAAGTLRPEHAADFGRLSAALSAGARRQLLFVEFRSQTYREQLVVAIDDVLSTSGVRAAHVDLTPCAGFIEVEQLLRESAVSVDVIHLIGGERWFNQARWREFNLRREAVARDIGVRLLLWLNPEQIPDVVNYAPDLWAWRAGVYDFVEVLHASIPGGDASWAAPIDNRNLGERSRRIAELRFQLEDANAPASARLMMLDELATLLYWLGELDEALRIRRDEQLPVFEKLGDVRSRAMTQTKLGIGLALKGDVASARHLWQIAHADFSRMRLPEAEFVRELLEAPDASLPNKKSDHGV